MSQRVPQSMQGIENEDKPQVCPECGSDRIEFENSEFVCKKCGLVIGD